MYFVYILRLSDNSFYIGSAADLKRRLTDHKHGLVSSTKNFRPVKLVYFCGFVKKVTAMKFEKYLKSSSGFAFRNKHLI